MRIIVWSSDVCSSVLSLLRVGNRIICLVPILLVCGRWHVRITVIGTVGHLYTNHEKTTSKRIDMVVAIPGCLLLWVYMHQRILRAVQKRRSMEIVDRNTLTPGVDIIYHYFPKLSEKQREQYRQDRKSTRLNSSH